MDKILGRLTAFFAGISRRVVRSAAMRRVVLVSAALSVLFFLTTLSAFFYTGSQPAEVRQDEVLLSYEHRGNFDYITYLKPSQLYGEDLPDTTQTARYPAAAIDKIDFTYTFHPSEKTASAGRFEALLEIPGVWQRRVVLGDGASEGEDLVFHFTLDPGYFDRLFAGAEEALAVAGQPRLITYRAAIDAAGVEFTQTLPVSFGRDTVEIGNERRLMSFTGTGTFDFIVHTRISPEKLAYPAHIVDKIDFTFNYRAARDGAVTAGVDAVFANPGIWEKTVSLARTTGAGGSVTLDFSVDPAIFRGIFGQIENETGITPQSRDVTINAWARSTGDDFSQELMLSLKDTLIEIGNDLTMTEPGGSGEFSYLVRLTPNSLFTGSTIRVPDPKTTPGSTSTVVLNPRPAEIPALTSLKPGEPVFLKLVDTMSVTYAYQLASSKTLSNVASDISVDAAIEAPSYWSKTFRLLEAKKTGRFAVKFPVDIGYYSLLMDNIRAETGVSAESYAIKLTVNVHTRADSPAGKIDEVFTQVLQGTLKNSLLQWDKQVTKEKPGAVNTTRIVPNPVRYLSLPLADAKTASLLLAVVLLPLSAFLLFIYVTSQPELLSAVEKEIQTIKKKYGQRIAEASELSSEVAEKYVRMNSMADLVAIADELGKPIIHRFLTSPSPLNVYFVLDGATRYEYRPDNAGTL